ncbi:hypothetical protein BLOT_011099 [Blomia tropicalis]|nr:hypothetical protein BLOT_011099 [Blomia tropicalis]
MDSSTNDSNFGLQTSSETQQMLDNFWKKAMEDIHNMNHINNDFRNPELPLARIKKIMKLDENVKMISGEAPVLFAKAVEIFIAELSLRAWVITENNKRRTLQRNDISVGISKFDVFDFLIDIVPREEVKPMKKNDIFNSNVISQDQLNYFFQIAQQQPLQAGGGQPIQIIQTPNQNTQFAIAPQVFQLPAPSWTSQSSDTALLPNSQVVQLNPSENQQINRDKSVELSNLPTPLILSGMYNNGEVVQQLLSSQQYQTLLQNQNSTPNQPIIISNQQLSMSTQFINNTVQVVQAIIPTSNTTNTNVESIDSNEIPVHNEERES